MSKLFRMYTDYAGQVPAELRPYTHTAKRAPLTAEQIAQRDEQRERANRLAALFGTVKAPTTYVRKCTCVRDAIDARIIAVKCEFCQMQNSPIVNNSNTTK